MNVWSSVVREKPGNHVVGDTMSPSLISICSKITKGKRASEIDAWKRIIIFGPAIVYGDDDFAKISPVHLRRSLKIRNSTLLPPNLVSHPLDSPWPRLIGAKNVLASWISPFRFLRATTRRRRERRTGILCSERNTNDRDDEREQFYSKSRRETRLELICLRGRKKVSERGKKNRVAASPTLTGIKNQGCPVSKVTRQISNAVSLRERKG